MAILKPEVKITLFPGKKTKTDPTTLTNEPTPDYIADAEAAATRVGEKAVIGASIVAVVTVAAATLGSIAVIAVNHALNK